jgi:hypothetical protein
MTFLSHLSALLRTGDTRTLELVVGLIAMVFGGQLAATLVGALPASALVRTLPDTLAWGLVGLFLVCGLGKIVGAIMDTAAIRIAASLSLSGVWLYLVWISSQLGATFSVLLFIVFTLQSAWVYIRLSILRKRAHAT